MHYEFAVFMPLLLAREKLFFSRREKNNAERDGVRGLPRQDEPDREKRSAEWSGVHWNHMRQHVCYKGHPVICLFLYFMATILKHIFFFFHLLLNML